MVFVVIAIRGVCHEFEVFELVSDFHPLCRGHGQTGWLGASGSITWYFHWGGHSKFSLIFLFQEKFNGRVDSFHEESPAKQNFSKRFALFKIM
jgi:hypothetical protein